MDSPEPESYFAPIVRSESDAFESGKPSQITDREELQRLALVSHGSSTTLASTPGAIEKQISLQRVATGHPSLDPSSPQFDCRAWVRWFLDRQRQAGTQSKPHGITFKNLTVSGFGPAVRYMETVLSALTIPFCWDKLRKKSKQKTILTGFNGSIRNGEMLLVLGRPGSGCSTLLRTIANELNELKVAENSIVHYSGIPQREMKEHFRGETTYNEETDTHFPHLTVWQTLQFAAKCKTPNVRYNNVSKKAYADELAGVVAAAYGLWDVRNTVVGNDWIRGVSGGQRKRVSLAEMALAGNTMACWDNSTRGLDSATALEFVQSLRLSCEFTGACHAVAIYQASQAIYDLFDKVTLLYEGRQIYFGPVEDAKRYFEAMGWVCPPRQTTADFLTSVTNPLERQTAEGREHELPHTAEEFAGRWRQSDAYKACIADIERHEADYPPDGSGLKELKQSHRAVQSKHARPGSPYITSIPSQINVCLIRATQLTLNQISTVVSAIIGQVVIALIVGSIYFGTPDTTSGLYSKASALFIAILFNALQAVGEIAGLYQQRPIVAKQAGYGFCHPFADSLASILLNLPIKLVGAIFFNIVLYFLAGLRRDAAHFFVYFLFVTVAQQTMTMMFRTMASVTRTLPQALTLSGIMVLIISIYTGFSIPRPYMRSWFEWLSYINPVFYAFEALLVNEVHGAQIPCGVDIVPFPYPQGSTAFICSTAGAFPGRTTVSGDQWVSASYGYSYSHLWRNLGIVFAFLIAFMCSYLVATELNASHTRSSAGPLTFKQDKSNSTHKHKLPTTEQVRHSATKMSVSSQRNDKANSRTFNWSNITYDIPMKGAPAPRRLLNDVSGWVEPGTLTALMGSSGAGKTTLLDVLAQRTNVGVVGGNRNINGETPGSSFQRDTGYVQQQDLHLSTSTVREALRFSAALRQPRSVPMDEKYAYVEEIIDKLGIGSYGDALVGDSDLGEGLSVEQRKMLSIGVELVAKPSLLLFLDEPTSGLDSQSAYSIVSLLRTLADEGQAILATIHQPSAVFFEEFDRLLFMAAGGKTIYFGDLGKNSRVLLDYFERQGARYCDDHENPAEYMLEIVGTKTTDQDWHEAWTASAEKQKVEERIVNIRNRPLRELSSNDTTNEFAASLGQQLRLVMIRIFQQYWRSPTYIISKLALAILSSLFIGFTFYQSDSSQRGLQNILLSIFSSQSILSVLVQQIMPRFVVQRTLYEARERPSRMYSWLPFVISNIVVEIPYQAFLGIVAFASYHYAVFGIQSSERQGLILLFFIQNFIFASTFAQMIVSGLPNAEAAGNLATIFLFMCSMFNGVMQPPSALPRFWIFMYRVDPLSYLVGGITSTGLHGRKLTCTPDEVSEFNPPAGQTCGQYLASYLKQAPGRLLNPDATASCQYCPLRTADQFLAGNEVYWSDRWRNFGILFAFIVFNILATIGLYWLARVRPLRKKGSDESSKNKKTVSTRLTLWARILFIRDPAEDKKGREAKVEKIY